jgi:hypothetical protein
MVATVEIEGDTFRAGRPQPILEGSYRGGAAGLSLAGNSFADYDVAPNGQRFVLFPSADESGQAEHPHITLITHWFDALRHTFASGSS